jgi:3-hydroxybutyryl-CoA dehydrogenase
MEIKKVGVVGCGIMGSGIVQVCAQSGYPVTVSELNQELLKNGLASINKFISKGVELGKVTPQNKESTLARIKGTTDLKDLSDCDLVIEAISEVMPLKKKIFSELDKICPKHTILATNTSVLCIIEIASSTSRREKVLGLHFCNPVPLMRLVEIVKTVATSDETLEIGKEFCKSIGKETLIAKDTPGFIINRLQTPYIIAAIKMYEACIASKEDIDKAAKLGLNFPMGPFEVLDLGALQAFYDGTRAMYEELLDPAYAPPPLLKRMLNAGFLGRKVGKGFYEYK